MKYRNFDPNTDTTITVVQLLQKLSGESFNPDIDSIDINKLITRSEEKGKVETTNQQRVSSKENLTSKVLQKYGKIASVINAKVLKQKSGKVHSNTKASTNLRIAEYDRYLNDQYPLAALRTEEKCSILLKQRVKEMIDEKS